MRTPRRHSIAPMAAIGLAAALVLPASQPAPAAADGNEAPAAPAGARGLSAGANHTCAIVPSGALRCWGSNANNQVGTPGFTLVGASPGTLGFDMPKVELGSGRTAVAVSAGDTHTCAVLDNATVKCWGSGADGRLGNGSTTDITSPSGAAVSLGTGRTATAVTAGGSHTCALLDNGTVKCWGRALSGQLGYGDVASRGDAAGEMGDSLPAVDLGAGRTATAIATGANHTCALLDNGSVKCWGANGSGQLGDGDTVQRGDGAGEMGANLPTVDLGPGRTATAISAGASTTCALLDNGTVKCWGLNNAGQLGVGDVATRGDGAGEMGANLPAVDLGTGRTATAVSTGGTHTCALLDNGRVKCWGQGGARLGQGSTTTLGDGPNELGDNLAPLALGTGRTATAITTGGNHSCATLDNGARKCWGTNSNAQLGQGDLTSRGSGPGEMGDNLFGVRIPPVGLVEGEVDDAVTHAEVNGADVIALRTADFGIAGRTTASPGSLSYRLEVPPGTYFLYLLDGTGHHRDGFAGPPTPVTVTDGGFQIFDVTMAPTRGAFSGLVTDQVSGGAIASAAVFAIGPSGIAGKATTDSTGHYTIPDLAPGSYHAVVLDAPGGARAQRFYPASPDFAGSSAFNVTTGATTAGIDVALSG